MNRITGFLLLMILGSCLSANPPQLPMNVIYDYELIRFYLQKAEYDLAIKRINEIQENNTDTDSLHYFKGLAYKGKAQWEMATDEFSYILINSRNRDLINTVISDLTPAVKNLDAFTSIEKISQMISEVNDVSTRIDLLLMIAVIYEDNQLFSEANDVYRTLINEADDDHFIAELLLRIAANNLFLKNYQEVIENLEPVLALQDSVLDQSALFFDFLAQRALGDNEKARESLLELYFNYPEHVNRKEIIEGLASIYQQEKKYMLSWYMLIELLHISTEVEIEAIQNDIRALKEVIVTDETYYDPFENLTPNFPNLDLND